MALMAHGSYAFMEEGVHFSQFLIAKIISVLWEYQIKFLLLMPYTSGGAGGSCDPVSVLRESNAASSSASMS